MKRFRITGLLIVATMCLLLAGAVQWLGKTYYPFRCLSLTPAVGMVRADLWYLPPGGEERGVLILCPGVNGNGRLMCEEGEWRKFVSEQHIGLVGLSFASPEESVRDSGYYHMKHGSGELLLAGIRKIYGKELPLYLYGFSGGAQFTARFVTWKPKAVSGWCAYSAGRWDEPGAGHDYPPGIVSCGSRDYRYEDCRKFFDQGNTLGAPWLWCRVEGAEHEMSPPLEAFARKYFAALLNPDGKAELIPECGLLPNGGLLEAWKALNGFSSPLPAGEPSPEGGR